MERMSKLPDKRTMFLYVKNSSGVPKEITIAYRIVSELQSQGILAVKATKTEHGNVIRADFDLRKLAESRSLNPDVKGSGND